MLIAIDIIYSSGLRKASIDLQLGKSARLLLLLDSIVCGFKKLSNKTRSCLSSLFFKI